MTAVRRRAGDAFEIHEDVPRTEDTEMMVESELRTEEAVPEEVPEEVPDDKYADSEYPSDGSSLTSEEPEVDSGVQQEMDRLQEVFPGFRNQYRLIKRIGEGTFSTVYKAEDLLYEEYDNDWDVDGHHDDRDRYGRMKARAGRFVAVKKIYVTSSPARIFNELELLYDLRNSPAVCPLITAFRSTDQVLAVLPYFRHEDFRDYFRQMTIADIVVYMRSLFMALTFVHEKRILHRDIKPTNFLYDPSSRRGVLVDFGLAEREGVDAKHCLCHEQSGVRRNRLVNSVAHLNGPQTGYPKNDTRPSRRANRAGTRGFRAPEVLFKCTEQTTKIDIWSAGVILLTILSKRFPFFNSADDVEAMIEIGTMFGTKKMRAAGALHGCMFETNIPTIGLSGFSLEKLVLWSTCRSPNDREGDPRGQPLNEEEKMAVSFLERCMDLDPAKRISASDALDHPFLAEGLPLVREDAYDEMALVES
ncbi:hypothetical protein BN1708_003727 [Verticillium longisporum]|uniref:non-specific serine/threonine protein kinase n=2 Tax=Verticillium longisporum TaxID=100787 RepID=A0A0G4LPZ8_VERLO|nr:hypothetical protein BN1708_003727 [Verticillium longisporum]